MFTCYYGSCPQAGNLSCECDYSIHFCEQHSKDHEKDSRNSRHQLLVSQILIEKWTEVGNEKIKKLNEFKESAIQKTVCMIENIQTQLQSIMRSIDLETHKIKKILAEKNFNNENHRTLHCEINIEDKGCDIKSFDEVIRNYLKIKINKKEEEEENLFASEISIFMNQKIQFNEKKKFLEIVNDNYKLLLLNSAVNVKRIAITNDNQYVVFTDQNNDLHVFNTYKQKEVQKANTHSKIKALVISNKHNLIITGGHDSKVIKWNLNDLNQKMEFKEGHSRPIRCIEIAPQDSFFMSGSDDQKLLRWNFGKKKPECLLGTHNNSIRKIIISKDTKYSVSSSKDGAVMIWNLKTGVNEYKLLREFTFFSAIAITSNNKYLAAGTSNGSLFICNIEKGVILNSAKISSKISYLGITADDKYVISGGANGKSLVFDLEKYQKLIFR